MLACIAIHRPPKNTNFFAVIAAKDLLGACSCELATCSLWDFCPFCRAKLLQIPQGGWVLLGKEQSCSHATDSPLDLGLGFENQR